MLLWQTLAPGSLFSAMAALQEALSRQSDLEKNHPQSEGRSGTVTLSGPHYCGNSARDSGLFRVFQQPSRLSSLELRLNGGGRGIRTPGTLSSTAVFKTACFNRSHIPPKVHGFLSLPRRPVCRDWRPKGSGISFIKSTSHIVSKMCDDRCLTLIRKTRIGREPGPG